MAANNITSFAKISITLFIHLEEKYKMPEKSLLDTQLLSGVSTSFTMRTVCIAALVLLVLEASCTTIFKEYISKECCVPNVNKLKWKSILSYTETDDICKSKAFIVLIKDKTQKKRKLCANALKGPVIAAIKSYNAMNSVQ
ncbi:uncharacterized protein LOC143983046 [Lithobates pipiens]